ncbi:MAG: pyridoxamine 5'-phosphate oxidase family protein [Geminicoccaceae bacterium]|nr:pyridoxamine 5'-phosphate oxidase family protein [Geminicoccaceae bacterium]
MTERITDGTALRERYGQPSERAVKKELDRLDRHCRHFIARSPFLVMATAGADGRCDASPKGDGPGFVQVVDDVTLLIPDRLGNNRVDGMENILSNPHVGLIFFLPGVRETLRINGRAEIVVEEAVLTPMAVQGKPPTAAIRVAVEEVFMHCGKALIRSRLWDPATQIERGDFPSLGQIIADQIEGIDAAESDAYLETVYRDRLY